nr:DUF732 domain-containing protein [Mycobacterium sp.]
MASTPVAGAALAAAIALAAAAAADPAAGSDDDFLAALRQAGITYHTAPEAVAVGRAVCGLMDAGTPGVAAVRQVEKSNPGFTLVGAAKFAVIAADNYCPEHLDGGDDDSAFGGAGSLQAAVAGGAGH